MHSGMVDTLFNDGSSNIRMSEVVKLIYKQGIHILATLDLINAARTGGMQHKLYVDQLVHDRPTGCTSILIVFADNIEVVLWQHQDWNLDRRRI